MRLKSNPMEGDQIPGLPLERVSLTTGPDLLFVTWVSGWTPRAVSLFLSFYTQALTSPSPVQLIFFSFLDFIFSFIFWAMLCSMWDLSSPTRNQTHAPRIGSGESLPPDH